MIFEPIKIGEAEKVKKDFSEMFRVAFVDPKEKIDQPPIAISIGESEYKGVMYPIPFGTYGNFSCIVGESKSRKTFFKSMVEASYLGGNSTAFAPSFKGHNLFGKMLISFDTEQSHYHVQRVQRRVLEMVGSDTTLYKAFGLRSYPARERFEFIEWVICESEFKNRIGMISIDGYADLITDINNLEMSTELVDKLLKLTEDNKIHCTGILHKNFGTEKPRGHVGSLILQKAETIVFVKKDDEHTRATCEYSRNIPFEEITFGINKEWLPVEVEAAQNQNWI